jgi:hypothetical protein
MGAMNGAFFALPLSWANGRHEWRIIRPYGAMNGAFFALLPMPDIMGEWAP